MYKEDNIIRKGSSGNEVNPLEISLSPNPVRDNLQIKSSNSSCLMEFEIWTIYGEKILNVNSSSGDIILDLSHLPSSVYLLQIRYKDHLKSFRIIKE